MRLLLDTQVALWAPTDDPQLSPRARQTPSSHAYGAVLRQRGDAVGKSPIMYQLGRGDMPALGPQGSSTVPRRGIRGAVDPP